MRHYVVVALVVVLVLALCGVAGAERTIVVSVREPGLDKAAVTINVGDTVVWVNSLAAHITIFFSGGKEVWLVCGAPTRFYLAADETFTSGVIPPGAVASLCFADTGVYQYTVADASRGNLLKGTVTVK